MPTLVQGLNFIGGSLGVVEMKELRCLGISKHGGRMTVCWCLCLSTMAVLPACLSTDLLIMVWQEMGGRPAMPSPILNRVLLCEL